MCCGFRGVWLAQSLWKGTAPFRSVLRAHITLSSTTRMENTQRILCSVTTMLCNSPANINLLLRYTQHYKFLPGEWELRKKEKLMDERRKNFLPLPTNTRHWKEEKHSSVSTAGKTEWNLTVGERNRRPQQRRLSSERGNSSSWSTHEVIFLCKTSWLLFSQGRDQTAQF